MRNTSELQRRRSEGGFTVVELLMVVAILGVLAGMTMMISPDFVKHSRAEGGVAQALDILRSAREVAVSQRRNVEVRFIGTNVIQTALVEIPGPDTRVLRTIELENRMEFRLEDGVPDTPDLFGMPAAIAFGPTPTRMFTSESTFVNTNGDVLNGTLFLSIPGQANSARAITVFGTTGFLRVYRWDGRTWVE